MSGAHIRVSVQPWHYPGEKDVVFVIPLDEYTARKAFRTLDVPRAMSAREAEVFCTPAREIKIARDMRKMLADEIARQIIAEMEKRDLVNGYTREQDEAFYGKGARP